MSFVVESRPRAGVKMFFGSYTDNGFDPQYDLLFGCERPGSIAKRNIIFQQNILSD